MINLVRNILLFFFIKKKQNVIITSIKYCKKKQYCIVIDN